MYPSGFQVHRQSHFDIPEWTGAGYNEAYITSYLKSQSGSYNHPNRAIEPRIPGIFQYYSVAEDELAKIFAGKATAQDGADAIAAAWEKVTDTIGRDETGRALQGVDGPVIATLRGAIEPQRTRGARTSAPCLTLGRFRRGRRMALNLESSLPPATTGSRADRAPPRLSDRRKTGGWAVLGFASFLLVSVALVQALQATGAISDRLPKLARGSLRLHPLVDRPRRRPGHDPRRARAAGALPAAGVAVHHCGRDLPDRLRALYRVHGLEPQPVGRPAFQRPRQSAPADRGQLFLERLRQHGLLRRRGELAISPSLSASRCCSTPTSGLASSFASCSCCR